MAHPTKGTVHVGQAPCQTPSPKPARRSETKRPDTREGLWHRSVAEQDTWRTMLSPRDGDGKGQQQLPPCGPRGRTASSHQGGLGLPLRKPSTPGVVSNILILYLSNHGSIIVIFFVTLRSLNTSSVQLFPSHRL